MSKRAHKYRDDFSITAHCGADDWKFGDTKHFTETWIKVTCLRCLKLKPERKAGRGKP